MCNTIFQQTYGGNGDEEGHAIIYTSGQNMIIAGKSTSGSAGGYDGMLMKLTDKGDLVWNRVVGGAKDDDLVQVKQTADKGFIAIGQTCSAGNDKGDIWVIKTDASGTVTWSRYYRVSATEGATGKDIMELSSGGYALVANVNDSTIQGDGVVARLDATGTVLWMRRFDKGREDGLYALTEMNGELIVGGYATVDFKDALVMKLDEVGGDVKWAKRFTWHTAWNEETVSVSRLPLGGVTWVMKGHEPTSYNQNFEIEAIKMNPEGKLYGGIRSDGSTQGANAAVKHLVAEPVADGGYIFVCDDITPNQGMPTLGKLYQGGRKEWMRSYYYTSGAGNFYDVTKTGAKGYVCTGTVQRYPHNKIIVIKTDAMGMSGSCSPYVFGGNGGRTDTLPGNTFTWNNSSALTPVTGTFAPQLNNTPFTATAICKKNYCDPAPPVSHSDACTTAFFTEVKDKYNIDLLDLARTADGDVVAVGRRYYYWTFLGEVVKLRPDGTVRWAKQIQAPSSHLSGHQYEVETRLSKVITTKDDKLLIAGTEDVTIDNGVSRYGLIAKMDLEGNVLWARRLAQAYSVSIADVRLTEDGGFLITANGDYGAGGSRPLVIRTDADGKLVWQTELNNSSMVFRSLACSPGGIYVGLDFYEFAAAHTEVCKLDPKTGNLVWAKDFTKTDGTRLTNLGIERIADTLFIGIGLQKEADLFDYTFNTALLKLKEDDGQQLGAFRLSKPNMATPTDIEYINSEWAAYAFIKTADKAFAVARECVLNNDTCIQITKFYSDGRIAWSREYPNLKRRAVRSVHADGTGMLITGVRYEVNDINEATRSGFVMRVNEQGEIEGSKTGNCANVAATAAVAPVTFTEVRPRISGNGTFGYGPVTSTGKSITVVSSPTLAYPSCSSPALCNSLSVTGHTRFCGLGQTAVYTASKNKNCDMPVTWQVDKAAVTIMETTDNTLKVKFKKQGSIAIIALVDAGCKVIRDTTRVTVNKAAAELDLGRDTAFCTGTGYTLDAGKGFRDYRWQDGSTSQTYEVTTPGLYSVKVTDVCNETTSDEVNMMAAPVYPFSLGPDIEKCKEAAVTLAIPAGFTNYTWNTDFARSVKGQQVTLSPDRDTTYILTAEKETGCVYKDTLQVKILKPEPIDLGADRAICENDSLQLTVAGAFTHVHWSTGETGTPVYVKIPGQYTVTAMDAQRCISTDTMELLPSLPLPVVSLSRNPVVCENTPGILDAGNTGSAYLWSTGETTSSISVKQPGSWWVRVTGSNGCVVTDTAFLKELAPVPHDFLPQDTQVCMLGKLQLFPADTYNTYTWNTGAHSRKLTVSMPGIYWLEVTDKNGCTGRDTVQVAQKECLTGLYVPTAFSPNGDGTNDLLLPVLRGRVIHYRFMVYNRWGSLVFESSELQEGWDGNVKGHTAPAGGYVWICTYQLQDQTRQVGKGAVLLIR